MIDDLIKRLRAGAQTWDDKRTMADAADLIEQQFRRIGELEAARIAYASEFPPDAEGLPDVGNVHANILAMKKDASRYQFIKSKAERGDTGWMFFWRLRTVDIPISQPRATLDEAIDFAVMPTPAIDPEPGRDTKTIDMFQESR